ncbi:hypothetical protein C7S16_3606 [Burkholderia thailandensis]|uniref:Uncharacterized protein n=1 Tax=Burkholderia thailandensis TaxID=57975 RepID=A0AAW9D4D3_BURTH|nr:hypothetical protein [Burkholderia thailandensis]MDW9256768.1 hypothetical protein [Burkholderia thailandensis]
MTPRHAGAAHIAARGECTRDGGPNAAVVTIWLHAQRFLT